VESLVVDPGLPYAQLAGRLRALGWQWRREAQSPPTLPGEPEYVLWQSADERCRLLYTFNPVIFFRVVQLSGPRADAERKSIASFVPHLDVQAVSERLDAEEVEACLLGLFAARELELFMLLPRIYELTESDDELVREFACDVEASLENMLLVRARQAVEHFQRSGSDETGDLPLGVGSLGSAALRRQVLRQAAVSLSGERLPGLHFLLRAGLSDRDWETRASAMILAARTGFTAAKDLLANITFVEVELAEIDARDRDRLVLVQRAAGAILAGEPEPAEPLERHARRCILNGEDGTFDDVFRLVYSLTVPLDIEPRDASLPPYVVATANGFALARSGIELVRVAASACWLGEPDSGGAGAKPSNPFRRVTPQASFFIARHALDARTLQGLLKPPPGAVNAEPQAVTLAQAEQVVSALSALEGARVTLPGPDQWEMAARGNDGRRYPWGNSRTAERDVTVSPWGGAVSPWGVAGLDRGKREWVRALEGEPRTCGGKDGSCSQRDFAHESERYAVRPVVLWGR
jgi:Sulfatase-modifying factor enzyme 1